MGIFRRGYEIDPFPVHDKVTFRNIDRVLPCFVRADASQMVINLNKVQKRLSAVTEETSEADRQAVALAFAEAIFGEDQAKDLMRFYNGDSLAVITVCGRYFRERLSKLITKAQKAK